MGRSQGLRAQRPWSALAKAHAAPAQAHLRAPGEQIDPSPPTDISVCAQTQRRTVKLIVLSQESVDCLKDTLEQSVMVLVENSMLPLQVAQSMAQEWAIFKVGTSDMVPGPADAWAYVLKGRVSTDEQPSEFEQLAMQRSCLLVVEVRMHSPSDRHPAWNHGQGLNCVQSFTGSLQHANTNAYNMMPHPCE